MFLWKPDSLNIGIIHIDTWGHIKGHKTLPREEAKSLYMSLRKKGALLSNQGDGVEKLPDYKRSIEWLLRRI